MVLSLAVLAKNWQWWTITVGFLKFGSDEAGSDVQFYSTESKCRTCFVGNKVGRSDKVSGITN